MVEMIGLVVLFIALNDGMFPLPVAFDKPIVILEFVQLKVVPVTPKREENIIALEGVPLQIIWLFTASTVGIGFIVNVKLDETPIQPFAVGVTVIVAMFRELVVFWPIKIGIDPFPDAANPTVVFELTQENVEPVTVEVGLTSAEFAPEHRIWFGIILTVGVGLTIIVKTEDIPLHPPAVGVTVIVEVIFALLLLVAVNWPIEPVPLEAKPVEVLLLVQL